MLKLSPDPTWRHVAIVCSRPSWERFCQCVKSVCKVFDVSLLRERQLQALYSFVSGEDVFVNLPTGYGKSLIFQMAPLIHVWMHENVTIGSWKKEPIILIISPLLALMQGPSQETHFAWT